MSGERTTADATGEVAAWTVKRVLEWTIGHLKERGSDSPRLDAEVLLAHVRNTPRIKLYTDYDVVLTDAERARMRELVKRRANAEPVAYLAGYKEFFSLKLYVTHDVLIPRPDTETLVMAALDCVKGQPGPVRILDLCTGSGCVAVALAKNLSQASVVATDLHPEAIAVAGRNINVHQLSDRVQLRTGDLYAALEPGEAFDVIVSNPPYIPTAEISGLEADVRSHEPHSALDGGPDGLELIRRLVREGQKFLVPGGFLMFELSPEQASTACTLMTDSGYCDVDVRKDIAGRARVVMGRKPD